MTTVAPEKQNKDPKGTPSHAEVSEREARAVAEAAREQEWRGASFVRDLFAGDIDLRLIHPYPEVDADEEARAQPWLEKLQAFGNTLYLIPGRDLKIQHAQQVDQLQILR